jgi:hypothetical protein
MTYGIEYKKVTIEDDMFIYRYGMTVKELREHIQYKIGMIDVKFEKLDNSNIEMSSTNGSGQDIEDEIEEEELEKDDEEWTYTPFGTAKIQSPDDDHSALGPSDPKGVRGTAHLPDWDDDQIGQEYQPSWFQKKETVPETTCEHKHTRDVELIFTTATECVDCGHRLK